MSSNDPEPDPVPNDRTAVWEAVLADIAERDLIGKEKYGVRLQPFNGRKPLVDAYQEALDLVVYLKQAIMEEEENAKVVKEMRETVKEMQDDLAGGAYGCNCEIYYD